MNRFILAGTILAIGGASFAQSPTAYYSPRPKFETYAGYDPGTSTYNGYAYITLGRYAAGRYQMGDGNFHNVMPIMTAVSYRPNGPAYSYYSYYGTGRTWSNVTLNMSETTLTQMGSTTGSTWTANQTSTPNQVFSSSVSWPPLNGTQAGAITGWSNYAFTFTAPHVRTNLDTDILCDYQFSGGVLSNSAYWSGSSTRYYRLDGYPIESYKNGPQTFYNDDTTYGCKDSRARPPFSPSYTYLYCTHYGPTYSTTSFKNTMRFYGYGYNAGPNAPYIMRLGLAINPAGLAFGTGCQKWFISGAAFAFPGVAGTYGSTATEYFGLPNGIIAANPAFVGLKIINQVTWKDTYNGNTKLSAACSTEVPALDGIASIAEAMRYCRYFYNGTGLASYSYTTQYGNPITRYN